MLPSIQESKELEHSIKTCKLVSCANEAGSGPWKRFAFSLKVISLLHA
jgi:hypothetical protein